MVYDKTIYPRGSGIYSYSVSNFLGGITNGEYDEGLVAPSKAVQSYNFDFSGGNLKNGVGFEEGIIDLFDDDKKDELYNVLKTVGSIIKIFVYRNYNTTNEERDDKLLLLSSDLSLFILNLNKKNSVIERVRNITFTSIPTAVNYRLNGKDVLLLSSVTDNLVVYDGVSLPYEILDAPKISSMDIHYERLFVTTNDEKARVYFSADLDPTMWTIDLSEAGFIEMVDERGALNRVISFNDYLYIFRDYGISRITAFGDQEGFSVSHLFVSSAKIYPESVAVCGDRILFLASNGLYAFDGFTTTKLLTNIANLLTDKNYNSIGSFFEGKYYLACNINFDSIDIENESGFKNNALLIYDIKDKTYKISRGVDICYMKSVNVGGFEKLYVLARSSINDCYKVLSLNDSGMFLSSPLKKVWKTDFYSFNKKNKNKCIRSVTVTVKGEAELTIRSNINNFKTIKLYEGTHTYNFFVFGYAFSFEFVSLNPVCEIISPSFTICIGGDK